jgi:menaquinone-specific isochorismate synthase
VLFDHAEKKEGEIGAPDIAHWLKTSLPLLDQPRVWVYGQWTPGFGFFGATPELLLQAQRRPLGRAWDLRTMALAGTAPRSSVAKWPTEKDLREHESVVRDLVERWPGAQQTPMQEVTTTTGLRHLLTEIYHSCDFAEPREIEKVVAAMHPTPALGARPRSALGELKRAELEPRGGFGAPVYVSTPNRVLAVVAIRGFDWANRRLRLGAGGGLVAKSEIELEWQEQVTKRESVRRFWGFV